MWQSMVTQFNEGKKYIMDLIDQSTMAYDQREELCTKLQQVRSRNESDRMLHIQEMREIQRKLEHDSKLHEFYDIKGHRRVNVELEQREANKKAQQKDDYEKQLADYKRIIEEIKDLCEEEQTEKFAAQYTRQEEENFALFNYVNELSHEVELLNETTQELTEEIGGYFRISYFGLCASETLFSFMFLENKVCFHTMNNKKLKERFLAITAS